MRIQLLSFVLCCAFIASWNASAARGEDPIPPLFPNPNGLALSRVAPATYTPDTQVEIQVTISAEITEGITAIGLWESVPDGWRYVGIRAITNELPFVIKSRSLNSGTRNGLDKPTTVSNNFCLHLAGAAARVAK